MSPITTAREKVNQGSLFFLGAAFLLSLWNFYLESAGIRIFDFLFLPLYFTLILICYLQNKIHIYFHMEFKPVILIILLIQLIYCLVSIFLDPKMAPVSAMGASLCLIAFAFFSYANISKNTMIKIVNIILIFHGLCLIIQLAVYLQSNIIIDPFTSLGRSNRLLSNIFRPAGLYAEPAGYCLSSFLWVILKLRLCPKMDFIIILTFTTMLISLSLWGFVAIIALLIFMYRNKVGLWLLLLSLFIFAGAIIALLGINLEDFVITARLMNIGDDGSANVRFGALSDLSSTLRNDPTIWFGNGPNSKNYMFMGANAAGYMLGTWGILGSLLFFLLLLKEIKKVNLPITIFGLLLALTAGVIWTTFFWWMWLALMMKDYSSAEENKQPLIHT